MVALEQPVFARKVNATVHRRLLDLDDLLLEGLKDAQGTLQAALIMRLILGVNHILHVRKHHFDARKVQHFHALALGERRVEDVHRHRLILDHVQRVDG